MTLCDMRATKRPQICADFFGIVLVPGWSHTDMIGCMRGVPPPKVKGGRIDGNVAESLAAWDASCDGPGAGPFGRCGPPSVVTS